MVLACYSFIHVTLPLYTFSFSKQTAVPNVFFFGEHEFSDAVVGGGTTASELPDYIRFQKITYQIEALSPLFLISKPIFTKQQPSRTDPRLYTCRTRTQNTLIYLLFGNDFDSAPVSLIPVRNNFGSDPYA